MKWYLTFLVFCFTVVSVTAQIDNNNKSVSIPAVESEKDSLDSKPILLSKPINNSSNTIGLNAPRISTNINLPKKQFSMFPEEEFGNPGELYVDQVNKNIADLKLSPEEIERKNGSTTDQFLGEFKSGAKFVNVVYRDHGFTDGDIIQVLVNDDIIYPRVYLIGSFRGFKLDLKSGINKIDFLALNQGESGPNTAEFRVVDDEGHLISANQWNLATGVRATIIVNKE